MKKRLGLWRTVGVCFSLSVLPVAASAGPLDQVVAGAKEEGKVTGTLKGIQPKSVERLRKEIKDRYGVDLEISLSPTRTMPKDYAKAAMERKVGATPTYDVMNFNSTQLFDDQGAVLEHVDWKPLLSKDTNPGVVLENPALRDGLVIYSQHIGLLYNSKKVSPEEVPKKLGDLADPKWRGKVGVYSYTTSWARWAFILGKDRVLSDLRAIMKNKAIQGRFADEYNRFTLGEIDMAFIGSGHYKSAVDAGIQAAWRPLDFDEIMYFSLSLIKGAQHPNAAKLLAVYLASPEGAKFLWEENKLGNLLYPGSLEHEISEQAKKLGIPQYSQETYPGYEEYRRSKEQEDLQKEIKLILQTGGK